MNGVPWNRKSDRQGDQIVHRDSFLAAKPPGGFAWRCFVDGEKEKVIREYRFSHWKGHHIDDPIEVDRTNYTVNRLLKKGDFSYPLNLLFPKPGVGDGFESVFLTFVDPFNLQQRNSS